MPKQEFSSKNLNLILCDLIRKARHKKFQAQKRKIDLMGNGIRSNSRGPVGANGRACPRWEFYLRSVANHEKLTDQITAISSLLNSSHKNKTNRKLLRKLVDEN
jgi:hypothetical protein